MGTLRPRRCRSGRHDEQVSKIAAHHIRSPPRRFPVIVALLDTDTTIALLRGDKAVADKARKHPAKSLGISAVTLYELRVGVEKSRDPTKNRQFLSDALAPFVLLPFDDSASLEAAKVRAILEKKGKGIGPYDTLIAGHTLAVGGRLVTANTREFGRVPGLKLENWISQ